MDDLISRQVALDALGERPVVWSDNDDYTLGERNQYDMDRLAIETVPSVSFENHDEIKSYSKDTISREAAVEAMRKAKDKSEAHRMLIQLPSAQPTLYGYSIESLAAVAEIMKKENVGPEEALQLFKSASYIAELVRAEWYENVQKQMEQMFAGGQDGV